MKFVVWLLGVIFSALSLVMLIKHGFDVGFASVLDLVVNYYERTMSVLFEWAEPYIMNFARDFLNWRLNLQPHWKHLFVLTGIYFFREAGDVYSVGNYSSALFLAVLALSVALFVAVAGGTVPIVRGDAWANFLICATPVTGVVLYEIGRNAWAATWFREINARFFKMPIRPWWSSFRDELVRMLWRAVIALVFVVVALQVPIVQRLSSPGVALLALIILALALYWAFVAVRQANFQRGRSETWYHSLQRSGTWHLGISMLATFFGAVLFLLTNAGLGLLGL